MLSDEEIISLNRMKLFARSSDLSIVTAKDMNIVVTLVEKQQKEIEELKEYKHDAELTKIACCTAQNCEALNNCIKLARELQNVEKKWQDKIKAKIEEYENKIKKIRSKKLINEPEDTIVITRYAHYISVLQSLLN